MTSSDNQVDEQLMSLTREIIDTFGPGVRLMHLTTANGTLGCNLLARPDTWNYHDELVRTRRHAHFTAQQSWMTDQRRWGATQ